VVTLCSLLFWILGLVPRTIDNWLITFNGLVIAWHGGVCSLALRCLRGPQGGSEAVCTFLSLFDLFCRECSANPLLAVIDNLLWFVIKIGHGELRIPSVGLLNECRRIHRRYALLATFGVTSCRQPHLQEDSWEVIVD